MKKLLQKLITAITAALVNDPDNTDLIAKLKAELGQALAEAKAAKTTADELQAEKADLESLTPDLEALIELAGKATPPAPAEPAPADAAAGVE